MRSDPLTIPQGSTFVVFWNLSDGTTGAPLTSTVGYACRCQIKYQAGDDVALYTFPPGVFTDSRVTLTAPATATAAMTFGRAEYDVLVTDPTGVRTRVARGPVTLDAAVTVA